MKDEYILNPLKIEYFDGYYYCLSERTKKIYILNKNGFVKKFGRVGQGPGDILNPISIGVNDKYIAVLESYSGKVSFFNKNAKFIKTFKAEFTQMQKVYVSDFVFVGEHIYFAVGKGSIAIIVSDFNGKKIREIKRDIGKFRNYSHDYSINFNSYNNKILLLSKLTGELLSCKLKDIKIKSVVKVSIPRLTRLLSGFNDKSSSNLNREIFTNFYPLLVNKKRIGIVSLVGKRINGALQFPRFVFNRDYKFLYKDYIGFKDDDYPNIIFQSGVYLIIINKNGNVYKTKDEI
jgi:hypothetical protein